jgi:hypothetical protein
VLAPEPADLIAQPGDLRRELLPLGNTERVMAAIRELSGQEYVHMYASDRKAELAAAVPPKCKRRR